MKILLLVYIIFCSSLDLSAEESQFHFEFVIDGITPSLTMS